MSTSASISLRRPALALAAPPGSVVVRAAHGMGSAAKTFALMLHEALERYGARLDVDVELSGRAFGPQATLALEHDRRVIRVADDEGRPHTQRDVQRLARGGAPVFLAGGVARGEPAPADVDRVARELAGCSVGVALGAGGTRGFAHVGVLDALRRRGVPVDYIAGSSVGSVVGALWAFGHSPEHIMRGLSATKRFAVRPALPWRSLFGNSGIRHHIVASAEDRDFEDSPIPFAAVATDLHDGSEVVLNAGAIWPAVLASSSIPVLYPPVAHDGRWLVDGGIAAAVPVRAVRALGARKVIAVKLDVAPADAREASAPSTVAAAMRALELLQAQAGRASAAGADVVVAPRLGAEGFAGADLARKRGEEAVEASLDDLHASFPWLRHAHPEVRT